MRAISKILGIVIGLPIIIVAVAFAVANTGPVALGIYPFETVVELPIALLVFIVLLIGFTIGAISAFLGAGRLRRRVRNAEFRLRQMEMNAARVKREEEAMAARERQEAALQKPSNRAALAAE
ncbi:MAG: LapA family protein [Alphaproteobacteria bacterium]|nr:LapA family protein [Alphaproteobacteria bacterium]